jgi:hypothetical protein
LFCLPQGEEAICSIHPLRTQDWIGECNISLADNATTVLLVTHGSWAIRGCTSSCMMFHNRPGNTLINTTDKNLRCSVTEPSCCCNLIRSSSHPTSILFAVGYRKALHRTETVHTGLLLSMPSGSACGSTFATQVHIAFAEFSTASFMIQYKDIIYD